MSKNDRYNYLITIYNRIVLNTIYKKNHTNLYEDVLGSSIFSNVLKKIKILNKLIIPIFVVFYPLYLTYYFFKALLVSLTSTKAKVSGNRIFLAASIALPRISKHFDLDNSQDKWLLIPWNKSISISNTNRITVFNLLSIIEIFDSYIDSILIIFIISKRFGIKYILLALQSFKWLLFKKAIMHIPQDMQICFCNHKDIYAPLFDKLPHKQKILLQHGTEILLSNKYDVQYPFYSYNSRHDFWVQNMPFKYSSISKVFCFSDKEYEALRVGILKCNPEVKILGYPLKAFNENLEGDSSVLIIGYYTLFYELEKQVVAYFSAKGVRVYLKNHPLFPASVYEQLKREYNIIVLNGESYPKTNLVFSYGSTLALEYEALGASVVYYDNLDSDSLNVIMNIKYEEFFS